MRNRELIEDFTHDTGYAFRILRRSPGFTATAILALALGIGANTAIFTVVNSVLLQPLAYPEPDRLVQLELSSPQGNANITSIPKYIAWKAQTQVFSDVAAYDVGGPGMNLTGDGLPEQLKGINVSASYFRVFGVPFAAGRPFSDEEDRPGGPKLAFSAMVFGITVLVAIRASWARRSNSVANPTRSRAWPAALFLPIRQWTFTCHCKQIPTLPMALTICAPPHD
jgi:hypothetical protein